MMFMNVAWNSQGARQELIYKQENGGILGLAVWFSFLT